MKISTNIKDCFVVGQTEWIDRRGGFKEIFRENAYLEEFDFHLVQSNFSYSWKDVLRGLHVVPFAKIVGCLGGTILDFVVDLRKDSPTYLQYYSTYLNVNNSFVYVPPGCGHGFLSIEDKSVLFYMQSGYYEPEKEQVFNFFDPVLNIIIPKPQEGLNYNMSVKDAEAPFIIL
jgi:dTDP-4-dehydrorhamnose 3,5-epimerase